MIFAEELLKDCWDEVVALGRRHWNETQQYRHYQKFDPKLERYEQFERAGWLVAFTARENEELVGYSLVYIVPSMHTQETICTEDTWYIAPEYRKGWTAIRFFKFIESAVKDRGAVEVSLTAPSHTKTGQIIEFLGYNRVSVQYSKSLVPGRQPNNTESVDVQPYTARAA